MVQLTYPKLKMHWAEKMYRPGQIQFFVVGGSISSAIFITCGQMVKTNHQSTYLDVYGKSPLI